MERHLALLRGINLGKRRLPMKELVALFEEAGCANVTTYVASGNVGFDAPAEVLRTLKPSMERTIAERYGFEVPLVMRSRKRAIEIVRNNPFLPGADPAELAVVYLADRPSAAAIAKLDPKRSPPDELRVRGSEIYLRLKNGFARTRLTNDWFDRTLETVSTARNWRTALKLCEL